MRKTLKESIGVLIILFAMLATFTGCGDNNSSEESRLIDNSGRINLVVLGGVRQNQAPICKDLAKRYVKETVESYGSISLITCESSPNNFASVNIEKTNVNVGKTKEEQLKEEYVSAVMEALDEMVATSPEVDVYKSIDYAQKAFGSLDDGYNVMLICDNMISTEGDVDFSDKILDAIDIDSYIYHLEESGEIIDLSSVDQIVIVNVGETVEPQKELSVNERKILTEFWEKLLVKCGCNEENISFVSALPAQDSTIDYSLLPEVSTITTVYNPYEYDDDTNEQDDNSDKFIEDDCVLMYDDETINFEPNTAVILTDMDVVNDMLQPVADYLIENNTDVLLIGGTASGGSLNNTDSLRQLAEERCNAVKDLLVGLGVEETLIHVVGTGIDNPFYVQDIDDNGNFIEEIGRSNRFVVLTSYDSDMAQQFK